MLQDVDIITPSTESTSILTDATLVGHEEDARHGGVGGAARLHNQLLSACSTHGSGASTTNPRSRSAGSTTRGRRRLIRPASTSSSRPGLAADIGISGACSCTRCPGAASGGDLERRETDERRRRGRLSEMLGEGSLDRCGVTLLAGKAVGAPFVGAVAATLVIFEVLRLLHGGPVNRLIDWNLINPDHRQTALQLNDFSPASTPAMCPCGRTRTAADVKITSPRSARFFTGRVRARSAYPAGFRCAFR